MTQTAKTADVVPTEGPWGIEVTDHTFWIGPMRDDGWKVSAIVFSLPAGEDYRQQYQSQQMANAKLIVSACNSYKRHFSDPITAAESDWIARAVEAMIAQEQASNYAASISATVPDGEAVPKAAFDHADTLFARAEKLRRALLSQVREVRG